MKDKYDREEYDEVTRNKLVIRNFARAKSFETKDVKLLSADFGPNDLFGYKEDAEFTQNVFGLFERIKTNNLVIGDTLKKSQVILYFLNDLNLFKVFDISPAELIEEILQYESSENNMLYPNELIQILELPRSSVSLADINRFNKEGDVRGKAGFLRYYFLLTEADMAELCKNYVRYADSKGHENMIDFIEAIHSEEDNLDLLGKLAYYIEPINRVLTLGQVLLCMRMEILAQREVYSDKKQHSWAVVDIYVRTFKISGSFNNLFGVPNSLLELFKPGDKIDVDFMQHLHELFLKLPSKEGYVSKEDFLIKIGNDERMEMLLGAKIRNPGRSRKGMNDELEDENLNQLLDRVDSEAEDYIDWEDFRQYFTRRGFPM